MRLKGGVNVVGMHPEMWPVLFALDELWRTKLGYGLVITSARDSRHSDHSRHYIGCAVDLRTWDSATSGRQLAGAVREDLLKAARHAAGEHFLIIDESDHFHIQMDIKQP